MNNYFLLKKSLGAKSFFPNDSLFNCVLFVCTSSIIHQIELSAPSQTEQNCMQIIFKFISKTKAFNL